MISVLANPDLERVYEFKERLEASGIPMHVENSMLSAMIAQRVDHSPNAIFVGCSIPPQAAVPVLVAAMTFWPEIRRVKLSSDVEQYTEEQTHYRIFLGGHIGEKHIGRFSVWSDQQINELDPDSDVTSFHWLIRRRSERPTGPVVPVRCVGGPFDGEVFNYVGAPPLKRLELMGKHVYLLVNGEQGLEYQYKGPFR